MSISTLHGRSEVKQSQSAARFVWSIAMTVVLLYERRLPPDCWRCHYAGCRLGFADDGCDACYQKNSISFRSGKNVKETTKMSTGSPKRKKEWGCWKMDRKWIENTATAKIVRAHGNTRGWQLLPVLKSLPAQNRREVPDMMSCLPIGYGWGRVDRAARSIGGRNGLLVATFDAAAKSDHFGRFSTQALLPTTATWLPNDLTLISLIVAGIIQSPSGLHVQSLRLSWKTLLWPCPFIVR